VRTTKRQCVSSLRRLLCWLVLAPAALGAQASPLNPPANPAPPPPAAPKPGEAPAELRDELGRVVRIRATPQRIVSIAPSLTETVFALDLGAHVFGDTDYCDYPAEARTRTHVGGPISPNIEQIAALHPDVVLATRALNRAETVDALNRIGIAVYTTDPHSVDDVIASTRHLGKLLGAEPRAEALAADMEQRLADLAKRLAGRAPRRVFFVVWTEPIISTGPRTFLADALRHAGAESVVNVSQDWPQVSIEELLRQNPDYLIFSGTHPEDPQSTIANLRNRTGWSSLDAVRENRFAIISDAINRPGPRIVDAIEDLARQLHPGAFPPAPPAAPAAPDHPRRGGLL